MNKIRISHDKDPQFQPVKWVFHEILFPQVPFWGLSARLNTFLFFYSFLFQIFYTGASSDTTSDSSSSDNSGPTDSAKTYHPVGTKLKSEHILQLIVAMKSLEPLWHARPDDRKHVHVAGLLWFKNAIIFSRLSVPSYEVLLLRLRQGLPSRTGQNKYMLYDKYIDPCKGCLSVLAEYIVVCMTGHYMYH